MFSLVSPRLFSWFQGGFAYRRVGCLMVKGGGWRWECVRRVALAHLGRSWPQALCEHVTPRRVLLRLQEDPHVWLSFSSPRLHATPPPLVSILCISISFLFTVVLFSKSALPIPSIFPLLLHGLYFNLFSLLLTVPLLLHLLYLSSSPTILIFILPFFSILLLLFLPPIHPYGLALLPTCIYSL